MDPVTVALLAAAAGGVGGETVKLVWKSAGERWFSRYFRDHGQKAIEQGQSNTVDFLSRLANRVEDLENQLDALEGLPAQMQRMLEDPDFSGTLRYALLSAARTDAAQKHEVLARAVVERMAAGAESPAAVAANLAVELLPRLASQHLHLLGLIALTYWVRPEGLPLAEKAPRNVPDYDTSESEKLSLSAYGEWLGEAFGALLPSRGIGAEMDYAHLSSASCVLVERKIRRALIKVLDPTTERLISLEASMHVGSRVVDFVYDHPAGGALLHLWEGGLQHVTPTPVGILIGIAAYDYAAGTYTALDLDAATRHSRSYMIDDMAWDGDNISERFLEQLDRAIEDRVERRVGIWNRIRKR